LRICRTDVATLCGGTPPGGLMPALPPKADNS
jgi:hypothetical protein